MLVVLGSSSSVLLLHGSVLLLFAVVFYTISSFVCFSFVKNITKFPSLPRLSYNHSLALSFHMPCRFDFISNHFHTCTHARAISRQQSSITITNHNMSDHGAFRPVPPPGPLLLNHALLTPFCSLITHTHKSQSHYGVAFDYASTISYPLCFPHSQMKFSLVITLQPDFITNSTRRKRSFGSVYFVSGGYDEEKVRRSSAFLLADAHQSMPLVLRLCAFITRFT